MNILIYKSFGILIEIINFMVLIRVLLSWIPMDRNNAFIRFIYAMTEPLLYPIRKLLSKSPLGDGMMLDFSPIILILLLQVLQNILGSILF